MHNSFNQPEPIALIPTEYKFIISKVLILLLVLLITNSVYSQTRYSVSGYVREAISGEFLPGVNVYLNDNKTGTITNLYGFYSLKLAPGKYQIRYSFVGYEPVTKEIDLASDQLIDVQLNNVSLEEVVISAERGVKITENNDISLVTVPIKQIEQIPALLGEKDVFKVLQLMPGVQKGSEGTSGLYVRGGGPDQNLIILDDAPVYNASHLFGFFSVFNGDALKSVELVKGGFPARYGGRLSSVIEMTMKDGNKKKIAGQAGIGLISSRILLEGPIKKDVSSFIISGRRTYVDALMRPFMNNDEKGGYFFYDLNGKVNYEFGSKNRLYLSGYLGRDKFNILTSSGRNDKEEGGLYWQNSTATLRWNHLFGKKVFANTSLIYSDYTLKIYNYVEEDRESYSLEYLSGIRDFSLKYDLDYSISPSYYLKTGVSFTNHRFSPSAIVEKDQTNLVYVNEKTRYESLESGMYVENNITLGTKVKINAGLRLSDFLVKDENYIALEPRITFNYNFAKNISFKAGYAEMNQYIHLLSNTGIGLPTDLWVPSTERVKPQHSKQVSAGLAKDFTNIDVTITIEGYYKISSNILGYLPGSSFLALDDPSDSQDFTWQDNVTPGNGKSYGTEFLIHKRTGKFNGWIGYTLSWTKLQFDEINFGKEFWARYDRRHDISVVAMYSIKPSINLAATWVYGTGNAITLPLGEYPAPTHSPLTDILEMAGQPTFFNYYQTVTDYGDMNSYRMKPYHRLDIGIQFIKKREKYERTWELGIYNTYNRKNPFFYFIDEEFDGEYSTSKLKQVSIFPLIPSISYLIKF